MYFGVGGTVFGLPSCLRHAVSELRVCWSASSGVHVAASASLTCDLDSSSPSSYFGLKFGFIEEKKKLDVQCQHRVVSTNSSSIYSDVGRLLLLLLLLQTSVSNQFSELLADLRLADLEALFFCNFSGNSSQVTYSRHGCSGVLSSFASPISGNS